MILPAASRGAGEHAHAASKIVKPVNRRRFLKTVVSGAVLSSMRVRDGAAAGTRPTLYNGIRLTDPWPPRLRSLSDLPIPPAYLVDPPDVIPIDLGRQLFVDDFLIEQTSLVRTFHRAEYHAANPVLSPATAWEKRDPYADRTNTHPNPAAMPFSDGVFFDPKDRLFKLWYMGGYNENTCYATSTDGIHWNRPALDAKGTNIVYTGNRDSSTVWIDQVTADLSQRYKMAVWHDYYLEQFISPDGIRWTKTGNSGYTGDRTTFFYNPFRNVWVFSLRSAQDAGPRHRLYWETPDFVKGSRWNRGEPVMWVGADKLDPMRPDYRIPTELYNLDCVAYESLLLGLFTIWRGERPQREKPNDICIGYSRDGFHWARPDRDAFLDVSERYGDWNWANVQSAGGACLVVGDRLYFYVSGRHGLQGTSMPDVCSTGLATLRRDGFVSMDHPGKTRVERLSTPTGLPPGTLITRPVQFRGRHLFVNLAAASGELRVEVLEPGGATLVDFTAATCVPVRGDSTSARVTWTGAPDLAAIANRPVRFKFQLTNGALYAFWVSADPTGASHGFVAAGGPGFTGPTDTIGHR
jgi:hypothetical protein